MRTSLRIFVTISLSRAPRVSANILKPPLASRGEAHNKPHPSARSSHFSNSLKMHFKQHTKPRGKLVKLWHTPQKEASFEAGLVDRMSLIECQSSEEYEGPIGVDYTINCRLHSPLSEINSNPRITFSLRLAASLTKHDVDYR
jgi:hypothetical protein